VKKIIILPAFLFITFISFELTAQCSAPTSQATSAVFGTETSSTLTLISFTAPTGDVDGYLVYINDVNSFKLPTDGDEPTQEISWNDAGQQVIYFGTSASPSLTISDLEPGTQYFFQVYAYNDCNGTQTYELTGLNASDISSKGVLTIAGFTADNKVYDGTTRASATGFIPSTGTAYLSGVVSDDIVILGGAPLFTFNSPNVGTGITITTSGYTISGADAGKYTLTQPTLSANITAKALTTLGVSAENKVYDGTTVANAIGTPVLESYFLSLNGFNVTEQQIGPDANTITTSIITFTEDVLITDVNIMLNIEHTWDADLDVKLIAPDGTTEVILFEDIGATGDNFTNTVLDYDASLAITDEIATPPFTGSFRPEGSFTDFNGLMSAGDWTLYIKDDDNGDQGTLLNWSIEILYESNDVSLGGTPVFTFASANVGTDITVNTSGYTILGADAGNYALIQPILSSDITPAPLTVTASSDLLKVYGESDPALSYSITGLVFSDVEDDLESQVTISRAVGEDVGAYLITPASAADSNYAVSFVTSTFGITPTSLLVTGLVGDNKVYDGTTVATASGSPVLSGIISDDDVALEGSPVFSFESAELATDIAITTTGFIITGSDHGNYTLTQPTLSADIVTTLGVDDITDVKLSLKIFPNPSVNFVKISGLSEKANYIIYNLFGKEILRGKVLNEENIFIQNLSNGTYFIKVENAKAIKFIKM
jgi:subtilisin-like proprotein convertase family protein